MGGTDLGVGDAGGSLALFIWEGIMLRIMTTNQATNLRKEPELQHRDSILLKCGGMSRALQASMIHVTLPYY